MPKASVRVNSPVSSFSPCKQGVFDYRHAAEKGEYMAILENPYIDGDLPASNESAT